jgi:diaminopimelate epimerase
VCVNMGSPKLFPWSSLSNLKGSVNSMYFPLELVRGSYNVSDVSMGNPHAVRNVFSSIKEQQLKLSQVIFVASIDGIMADGTFEIEGPRLSKHELFPNGTNAEFVEVCNIYIYVMLKKFDL